MALLAGTLALGPASVRAASNARVDFYDSERGLSQLSVKALAQTADGAMWIGTWSGLNRFDERSFEVFTERDGLPHGRISALAVAPDGVLWVGTLTGLSRRTAKGFETVNDPDALTGEPVHALRFGPDGRLHVGDERGWIALAQQGRAERSATVRGPVVDIEVDVEGRVWLATPEGVWRTAPGGTIGSANRVAGIPSATAVTACDDGRVVVGGADGLRIFESGQLAQHLTRDSLGREVSVRSSSRDSLGIVRITSYEGVLELRGRELVCVMRFLEDLPVPIFDVALSDREGNLWFGGFGGVARVAGPAFENHGEQEGLPSANVRPIVRGPGEDLWIGTLAGVARWDGRRWSTYDTEHGLGHDLVLCLLYDEAERLWVGHEKGLSLFDGQRFADAPGFPQTDRVLYLEEDAQGRLWAATGNGTLWIYDSDAESARTIEVPGDGWTSGRLLCTPNGDMWVSSRAGLCRYRDGGWMVYTVQDGLAAPEPYFLASGPDDTIWFGYHAAVGATRFDGREFRTFGVEEGLAHGSVYSIGADAQGNVWLGTARGVARFDGTRFRNYSTADGYASPESNSGGFFLDTDGSIWFGTAGGLSHYRPERDRTLEVPLLVGLRDPNLAGKPLVPGLRVGPGRNDFEVWIDAYSSVAPERLEVQCRVDGLDATWGPAEPGLYSLPNVPAGRYRLEVRARREGEDWTHLSSPEFEVLRPFYLRWPFLLAAFLTLALAVRGIVVWNTRRVRAMNLMLKQAVRDRTAELTSTNAELERANAAKSAFMANVSHEIRTPMNAVLGMTELVLDSKLESEQRERLQMVQASGEHLLQLINDILDVSKIEAGRLELDPAPIEVRSFLRTVLAEQVPVAHGRGLQLEYALDPDVPGRIVVDELRLRQVLINLLGNALKFTESGHVIVGVQVVHESTSDSRAKLRFWVQDTGAGIAPHRIGSIFDSFVQEDASTTRRYGGTGLGLTIVKQLVELMGGEIRVQSEQGVGSRFEFDVEVQVDPSDRPAESWPELQGTTVLVTESDTACRELFVRKFERRAARVVPIDRAECLLPAADAVEGRWIALVDPRVEGILPALDALAERPGLVMLVRSPACPENMDWTEHPSVDAVVDRPVSAVAVEQFLARPSRDPVRPPEMGRGSSAEPRPSLRVLVAEDNIVNQKLIVAMLQRGGHRCRVVENGSLAVQAAFEERFDVVLMDMQMPEMDGLEAAREIRRRERGEGLPRLPIVALTANAMVGDRERCLEAGMDDYLSKPVRTNELARALERTGQPLAPREVTVGR